MTCIAPIHPWLTLAVVTDYVEVGNMRAHTKFSLSADARVRLANSSIYSPMADANVTSGHEKGRLLFDPRVWLPQGVCMLDFSLLCVANHGFKCLVFLG